MIERIDGMPPGTVGLKATGKLTREDYHETLQPALREGVESGEMRLLFVLTGYDGLEANAWATDIKTGLQFGAGHHSAWKKFAFITDTDWVRNATHLFAWMIPGEVMVGDLDKLEEAKSWVAG